MDLAYLSAKQRKHMTRSATRIRETARCKRCGRTGPGVTTIEHRPWGSQPAGRRYHFCDECRAAVVERPLADVLADWARRS